ncbi:2Fe-2S iron-sulfur cluster-binding protein [Rhodoligotrophos appendicifer]|uniref:2Fe-2S iron-sulfur cluster-binding protein n=1 Tax=Rhodoligotrophos appendicifer TaxID=987056 RepID=UPI001FE8982D|nr:2Fe-2S iron-sulfur cluster-binding protein [Rhodoligotrophos appendicifer]
MRRSCREDVCGSCATRIEGTNWLACTRFISDMSTPAADIPLLRIAVGSWRRSLHACGKPLRGSKNVHRSDGAHRTRQARHHFQRRPAHRVCQAPDPQTIRRSMFDNPRDGRLSAVITKTDGPRRVAPSARVGHSPPG